VLSSPLLENPKYILTTLHSTTFNLADWLSRTPKSILAKSFGLPESTFTSLPSPNPYIQNNTAGRASNRTVSGGGGELAGDASYVYRTFSHAPEPAPGGGGQWWKIDSTNFPVAKTIASTYVVIEPKGVRELHWHPTVSLRRTSFIFFPILFGLMMTVDDEIWMWR
jgi:oxalate decarboxylase